MLDNWSQIQTYANKVPREFGIPWYNKDGIGLRWQVKDSSGIHNIRIDKDNIIAKYPAQRVDHVVISYNSKVIDNTGRNYIMYDSKTKEMYKIAREKADAGIFSPEHRFDIIKNPRRSETGSHLDAHIPADVWTKWKKFHEPD